MGGDPRASLFQIDWKWAFGEDDFLGTVSHGSWQSALTRRYACHWHSEVGLGRRGFQWFVSQIEKPLTTQVSFKGTHKLQFQSYEDVWKCGYGSKNVTRWGKASEQRQGEILLLSCLLSLPFFSSKQLNQSTVLFFHA